MTTILLGAEITCVEMLKGQARENGDAVITLLPIERRVFVAKAFETLDWKFVVRTLGLLQAQDVGTDGFQKFGDKIDAQAHRIDVPGRDRKSHGPDSVERDLTPTLHVMR